MNFGWIPPSERTEAQHEAHAEAAATMLPRGSLAHLAMGTPPVGTKVMLTDSWKAPAVVDAFGQPYPGWFQSTGCCVGVGGGNALQTLVCIEGTRSQDEKIFKVFWPLDYGISRYLSGDRGPGEGSLGSTFAKAVTANGVIDAASSGLPTIGTHDGMWSYGQATEMQWSDGSRIGQNWLTEAKKHVLKSATACGSATEVRDAILNGYPVTRAFSYFCNPGTAKVQDGALVGTYNGRGGHQESWLGYWNHSTLGEMIWEQNTWGQSVYGNDPGGGPAGGVWIKIADIDRMCRSGEAEIYAFSQFDGFPLQHDFNPW